MFVNNICCQTNDISNWEKVNIIFSIIGIIISSYFAFITYRLSKNGAKREKREKYEKEIREYFDDINYIVEYNISFINHIFSIFDTHKNDYLTILGLNNNENNNNNGEIKIKKEILKTFEENEKNGKEKEENKQLLRKINSNKNTISISKFLKKYPNYENYVKKIEKQYLLCFINFKTIYNGIKNSKDCKIDIKKEEDKFFKYFDNVCKIKEDYKYLSTFEKDLSNFIKEI